MQVLSFRSRFLSTPSARRATAVAVLRGSEKVISIHALREEGDACCGTTVARYRVFLSTPSARRATTGVILWLYQQEISIHALREEGD